MLKPNSSCWCTILELSSCFKYSPHSSKVKFCPVHLQLWKMSLFFFIPLFSVIQISTSVPSSIPLSRHPCKNSSLSQSQMPSDWGSFVTLLFCKASANRDWQCRLSITCISFSFYYCFLMFFDRHLKVKKIRFEWLFGFNVLHPLYLLIKFFFNCFWLFKGEVAVTFEVLFSQASFLFCCVISFLLVVTSPLSLLSLSYTWA